MKGRLIYLLLALLAAAVLIFARHRQPGVIEQAPQQHVAAAVADARIFRSISAAEAREMMRQRPDLLIIDVRTPEERRQIRLVPSTLVALGDVIRGIVRLPGDRPVLLLCAVGGRSYVAGKTLAARGHPEVYNLEGGIEAWRRAGFALQTGPE